MDLLNKAKEGIAGVAAGAAVILNPYPERWSDGVCGCCSDTGICLQTCCCTYCTLANIINKRDNNIGACDIGAFCGVLWGSYITGSDIIPWMAFAFRRELIQKYRIGEESVCMSCILAVCCYPCVFCQVQREMAKRGDHCGGICSNAAPVTIGSMAQGALASGALGGLIGGVASAIGTGHLPHPWSSGLCACSLMDCCEGYWCMCCMYGFMGHRLNAGRVPDVAFGAPNAMDPITCCSQLWYPYGHVYANRREIIQRYNVTGESHTMSCIVTLCCYACATCQQRREMGYCGEYPGGLLVKDFGPVIRV